MRYAKPNGNWNLWLYPKMNAVTVQWVGDGLDVPHAPAVLLLGNMQKSDMMRFDPTDDIAGWLIMAVQMFIWEMEL